MFRQFQQTNNPKDITIVALAEANNKYSSVFNSTHEGYAVLKEELEECEEALTLFQKKIGLLWNMVKEDADWLHFSEQLSEMQQNAYALITEATHTSAMVMKLHAYVRTQIAKKENEDM